MLKFKVGDKIKFLDKEYQGKALTGKIVKDITSGKDHIMWLCEIEDYDYPVPLSDDQIELIK